jgi:hypothetical protein
MMSSELPTPTVPVIPSDNIEDMSPDEVQALFESLDAPIPNKQPGLDDYIKYITSDYESMYGSRSGRYWDEVDDFNNLGHSGNDITRTNLPVPKKPKSKHSRLNHIEQAVDELTHMMDSIYSATNACEQQSAQTFDTITCIGDHVEALHVGAHNVQTTLESLEQRLTRIEETQAATVRTLAAVLNGMRAIHTNVKALRWPDES